MAYKIFLDTNIFLDVFLERTSDCPDAEAVLQLAAQNRIDEFTSTNNLINAISALRRQKLTQAEVIKNAIIRLFIKNFHTSQYNLR